MELLASYVVSILTERLRADNVQKYISNITKYAEAVRATKHFATMLSDFHRIYLATPGCDGITESEFEIKICSALMPERYMKKLKKIRSVSHGFIAGFIQNAVRVCISSADDILNNRLTRQALDEQFARLLKVYIVDFSAKLINPDAEKDSPLTIMTERAKRAEARIVELERELSEARNTITSLQRDKKSEPDSLNIFTDL